MVTPVSVFDTEDNNGVPDLFVRYRPFSMTASSVPELHKGCASAGFPKVAEPFADLQGSHSLVKLPGALLTLALGASCLCRPPERCRKGMPVSNLP